MRIPSLIVFVVTLLAPAAHAAIFTVGASGCTHTTIQAAVNAAASNGGADTIRVTRSQSYTARNKSS